MNISGRGYVGSAALTAVFLGAIAAHADEPVGNDEVILKDGGSLRGIVISSEPGVGVQILEYGQKEPRVIPWDRVSSVERGKLGHKAPVSVETPSPPDGAAVTAPAPTLQLGRPGVVRLHVESPRPVEIFSHRYMMQQVTTGVPGQSSDRAPTTMSPQ